MPSVFAKNTMFDIIQGKSVASNLIGDPVKKAWELLDRFLKTEFNDPVDHGRVINVDPEGEFLVPDLKPPEVERSELTRKILIMFKGLGTPNLTIVDDALFDVDKLGLQISHRQCQGNVDGLLPWKILRSIWIEDDGRWMKHLLSPRKPLYP